MTSYLLEQRNNLQASVLAVLIWSNETLRWAVYQYFYLLVYTKCFDLLYPAGWSLPHEPEARKLWLLSKLLIYDPKFGDVLLSRCLCCELRATAFHTFPPFFEVQVATLKPAKMSVAGFKKQIYKATQVSARQLNISLSFSQPCSILTTWLSRTESLNNKQLNTSSLLHIPQAMLLLNISEYDKCVANVTANVKVNS